MGRLVVVTGASGWIGRNVVRSAIRSGHRVVGVDRRPSRALPGVEYRCADITTDTFAGLAEDSLFEREAAIIHCAGYAHHAVEGADEVAQCEAVNRHGTARVVEFARQIHAARVVYVGSIAYYDWSRGDGYDEDGPLCAVSAYARSKLAGEMICRDCGLDWRVARLATVFGDEDRANFARLALSMKRRLFVIPGTGTARKSVLPVTLAADLLVDFATRSDISPRTLNLALPDVPSLAAICDAFSRECGFRRPVRLPTGVIRPLCALGDVAESCGVKIPLNTNSLVKLTTDTTVDVTRMMNVWGGRRWDRFSESLRSCAFYYRTLEHH